ncbi:ThiF family adenylyltransferase [Psychrobacillus sp. FSL H8-0484]|uniref:ThiF family adenylyltransferase n=1 Tax=Psychrobacillus sp. FSL H8-0484 TaxID=2921390 RepID=UPI0030FA67A3
MKITDENATYFIVCIGAGANGSHFVRNLLQDIATYAPKNNYRSYYPLAKVALVDGDKVEKKNLANQLFDSEDIGLSKTDALADRYGTHYKVDVRSFDMYVTTLEELNAIFALKGPNDIPVLVGLVDNNRTRMLLHEYFHSKEVEHLLYIDVGVEGVLLKEELVGDTNAEEKIRTSGFSGQVVCGYKEKGKVFLPPLADVYPSVLEDAESVFPTQSCGDLILNNPQRSATNKMAAQMTNTFLNNLFYSGEIVQEEILFNARYGTAQARFVSNHVEKEYQNFFKEMTNNGATSSIVS